LNFHKHYHCGYWLVQYFDAPSKSLTFVLLRWRSKLFLSFVAFDFTVITRNVF